MGTGRRTACAIALGAIACSGGGSSDGAPAAQALLGGTSMSDTPWPSDVFLHDGHLDVKDVPLAGAPASVAALAATLSELDGAPAYTSVFFPTNGGLPNGPVDGVAHWIDLDDASARSFDTKLFFREETKELVALPPPDAVLTAKHLWACVVASKSIAASTAMRDAMEGRGPFAPIYAPLASRLGADATAATVFRVGDPSRLAIAMVDVAAARPPTKASVTRVYRGAALEDLCGKPTTTRPGLGDPAGIVHDAIDTIVLGTYDGASFLSASPPALGRVDVDASGAPIVKGTEPIPFLLALPAKPATGWDKLPVLIFQHGLNASRAQVVTAANDYARAGYATIGIDAIWHGDRNPKKKDVVHEFTGAQGGDGLADGDPFGAAISLFDFEGGDGIVPFDGRYVRDNFRQALVDLAELVRLLQKGDVSAIASADPALAGLGLDAVDTVYTSESFGSVIGAGALAITPGLKAGVLSVGGGAVFLAMLPSSPTFNGLVTPFLRTGFDPELDLTDPVNLPGQAQRALSLVQAAIAPGDPMSFAPLLAQNQKSMLLLEARSDELIPNQSTDLFAAAAGATAVTLPSHGSTPRFATLPSSSVPYAASPTIALVPIDPALHTMFTSFTGQRKYQPDFPPFVPLADPQTIDNPIELVHALALGFATSLRSGGAARVVAP